MIIYAIWFGKVLEDIYKLNWLSDLTQLMAARGGQVCLLTDQEQPQVPESVSVIPYKDYDFGRDGDIVKQSMITLLSARCYHAAADLARFFVFSHPGPTAYLDFFSDLDMFKQAIPELSGLNVESLHCSSEIKVVNGEDKENYNMNFFGFFGKKNLLLELIQKLIIYKCQDEKFINFFKSQKNETDKYLASTFTFGSFLMVLTFYFPVFKCLLATHSIGKTRLRCFSEKIMDTTEMQKKCMGLFVVDFKFIITSSFVSQLNAKVHSSRYATLSQPCGPYVDKFCSTDSAKVWLDFLSYKADHQLFLQVNLHFSEFSVEQSRVELARFLPFCFSLLSALPSMKRVGMPAIRRCMTDGLISVLAGEKSGRLSSTASLGNL